MPHSPGGFAGEWGLLCLVGWWDGGMVGWWDGGMVGVGVGWSWFVLGGV